MDNATKTEIEAAAFRHLLKHLDENKQVQNIDLMNLAGFCRNCLSKWYRSAAEDKGIDLDYEAAREIIYGIPYSDWKNAYQTEATESQLNQFKPSQDS
ncbi:MAG: DUF1244 domain-containing protein [Pseudomonadota bacterium]|jgi:hypothetical protein|nr:DUF1244 domain-containing protein [Pseudomonadota bacterium]MEC8820875.1 DUF1244 domain-containing protein [Pseudomonadota bacterium]|tara:strand:+ start:228 stop:521 length:294 start_codon:yes stop_codon:yes gene_type:complete